MQKGATYYKSAIKYNEELETFAAGLAETIEDETVAKWCRSISNQHRFHAERHRRALAKLQAEVKAELDTPVQLTEEQEQEVGV